MDHIIQQKYIIGSDTSFSKFIYNTLLESINKGMLTTQFFMGNPKSFSRSIISDDDIKKSNTLLKRFPLHIFTHFPYICNLSGDVNNLGWNNNNEVDLKLNNVLKNLEYELNTLSKLNYISGGVVIHPGANKDRKNGLLSISKSINKLKFSQNSKLILEVCAGEGNKLCKNLSELKFILDNISPSLLSNIGICIDTCHIFASGEYDLRKKSEIDRLFNEFDDIIGMKYFSLIHLNDSQYDFGQCKDRHELLYNGFIWKKENLKYFLEYTKKYNIPLVLETCDSDLLKTCLL